MATKIRRNYTSVADSLRNEPWRFEFFEAVRLLHLMHKVDDLHANTADSIPDRIVTFKTHLSLNFPASEIQDLKDIKRDAVEIPAKSSTMTVNFMGLTGPSGVLPRHYTESLLDRRIRYKDAAAHQFFDLFNHRAISLFVAAWEKYRFYIGYEQGQSQNTLRYLLDLVGMGTAGLQNRLEQKYSIQYRLVKNIKPPARGIRDEMLAYYSGLIAQRPHSAVALAAILQDYFKVEVDILQFQGCWLRLEPDQYSRIGKQGAYHKLGESAAIGRFVWDHQAKFRVRIGPLDKETFDDFLPIGNAFMALKKFVDWYKPLGQHFDVQLVLRKKEIPRCRLGDTGSARLGWSTWLSSQSFTHDVEDTILN